jgi:hypothetical protein
VDDDDQIEYYNPIYENVDNNTNTNLNINNNVTVVNDETQFVNKGELTNLEESYRFDDSVMFQ